MSGLKQAEDMSLHFDFYLMYLFFDTETTGLPLNWKAPVEDVNNWPRLVQIAWILYNENAEKILSRDYIIKPQNFTIPEDASRVHGITTERAMTQGVPLIDVLNEFSQTIDQTEYLIAHNMSFDEKITEAEFIREKISSNLFKIKKICTKDESTNFCKIPGNYGYKWPKLSELHIILFGKDFEEAHDALVDVTACAKCFFELKKRNIIKNYSQISNY